MFMGLGDVILPGILVVSALTWLPDVPTLGGVGASLLVALGTLLGSLAGYVVLMRYVFRGRPQAGLPLLNGGALLGFLLAAASLYGIGALPSVLTAGS